MGVLQTLRRTFSFRSRLGRDPVLLAIEYSPLTVIFFIKVVVDEFTLGKRQGD